MSAPLRLLLLMPIGYVFSIAIAMAVFSYGFYLGGLQSSPTLTDLAIAGALTGQFTAIFGFHLFLPVLIAIFAGEAFGLRSWAYLLAAGGLIGAAPAVLPASMLISPAPDQVLPPMLAAGFVWGLVYWLIAGRLAGRGFSRDLPPGSA